MGDQCVVAVRTSNGDGPVTRAVSFAGASLSTGNVPTSTFNFTNTSGTTATLDVVYSLPVDVCTSYDGAVWVSSPEPPASCEVDAQDMSGISPTQVMFGGGTSVTFTG